MDENRKGVFGISKCVCDEGWKYYIAVFAGGSCEGFETLDIPSRTWAVFDGSGKSPEAIQDLEKRIFTEWLPSSDTSMTSGPTWNFIYLRTRKTPFSRYGYPLKRVPSINKKGMKTISDK